MIIAVRFSPGTLAVVVDAMGDTVVGILTIQVPVARIMTCLMVRGVADSLPPFVLGLTARVIGVRLWRLPHFMILRRSRVPKPPVLPTPRWIAHLLTNDVVMV